MKNKLQKLLFGLAMLAVVTPAMALEFELTAEVQGAYESNSLQEPVLEQDDLGINYGLILDIEHREANWDLGGNYRYGYIDYQEDLNEDETLFVGASDLIWRIKPGLFEWSFSHSRQNERRTALDADIPDNREVRQVFTTQPVMYFRLGSGDQIITSLRYVDVDQETANENNSRRYGGAVGWRRPLTAVSSFSINTEYSQVDFEAIDADYELTRAFIDYSADLRLLDYSIQLGVSNVEPDVAEGITAEFIRFTATLEQTVHSYTLLLLDELTDTSIALADVNFALNIDNRGTQNIDVFDRADLLTQKQAIFAYQGNILCRSCTVTASVGVVDLEYETADRSERDMLASASIGYAFTQNFNITLGVNYQDSELQGNELGFPIELDDMGRPIERDAVDIEEIDYTVVLDWQVSRRAQLSLAYAHEKSTSPIIEDVQGEDFNLNFDNDTVILSIQYRLW